MFVIRNAGNLVPHSQFFQDEHFSCEPAGLELGCVVNNIRHIIVCGHSDCKAINLLYKLQDKEFASRENRIISPLRSWLCTHASTSLEKFQHLIENGERILKISFRKFNLWIVLGLDKPLSFTAETPLRKFVAYIDPENKFTIEDKLSQINTLQQLQNVASYGFLKKRLEQHDLHIHALWFDIYTGDIYYFSRQSKKFLSVTEDTIEKIADEVQRYYSWDLRNIGGIRMNLFTRVLGYPLS